MLKMCITTWCELVTFSSYYMVVFLVFLGWKQLSLYLNLQKLPVWLQKWNPNFTPLHIPWVVYLDCEWSLPAVSILFIFSFFQFLDSVEICCSHIGWQSCNLHSPSFTQIGSVADSKRLIQGFYPFLLSLSVTEDAKSQPVDSLLLL